MDRMHAFPLRPAASARIRRAKLLALGAVTIGLLGTLAIILTFVWAPAHALPMGFAPDASSGRIAEGQPASLDDEQLPAIANLDPDLLAAMRDAAAAAAHDGIHFDVTSGWRSEEYQRWLFDDAITTYGSEELARQFVATPDRSSHVIGGAVDIGPVDAQFWLMQHGAQWGICQIYANERWHFELATQPGGDCPDMRMDAAG